MDLEMNGKQAPDDPPPAAVTSSQQPEAAAAVGKLLTGLRFGGGCLRVTLRVQSLVEGRRRI